MFGIRLPALLSATTVYAKRGACIISTASMLPKKTSSTIASPMNIPLRNGSGFFLRGVKCRVSIKITGAGQVQLSGYMDPSYLIWTCCKGTPVTGSRWIAPVVASRFGLMNT